MSSSRIVVAVLLACLFASAQTATSRRDEVDRIFAGFNNGTPGCAVGVAHNGAVVLTAGYGMADLERTVPITPDTVFESGSVAKQFTAATLLLLAREGKISLDDPMRKYLPELPDFGAPLTIRHVISHISGLREWRPLAEFSGAPEGTRVYNNFHLLEFAAKQRGLNFDPGTNYTYSNTGFNITPILVERVLGGKSFQAYTTETIFQPLGMKNTRWRDDFRAVVRNRALAYGKQGSGWIQQTPIENIIGAGGLLTTVGDLLLWNENFTHAKVGGPDFVKAQQVPATLSGGRTIHYAAGLMVNTVGGLNEVAHSGATGGYRTWLGRYPEKAVSVAVLCNSAQANPTNLGRQTARLWTGGGADAPATSSYTADPGKLQSLAGRYRRIRNNTIVEIEYKDGKLTMKAGPPLIPLGPGKFAFGPTATLTFEEASPIRFRTTTDDAPVFEKVEPVSPSPSELAQLAGEYHSPETGGTLKIKVAGGGLTYQVASNPPVTLRPSFRDVFQTASGTAVTFRRDAAGKVAALSVGDDRLWDLRFARVR